jgi:S-layer protein
MAVVTQTMQDNVTELYLGFFGRAPDAAGFGYWTNRLSQGDVTIQQISQAFSKTPEFISNYDGLTPTQQVTRVYNNVLNRAPDAGGLAYWVGQMTSGKQTIADVVWNVTNSAFIQTGTADGLLVQNKVTVGEYFAITLASNDTAAASGAYNLVTSNPASVATAEATLVNGTYTLTTNIETINVPKQGAYIVNGILGGAAPTFQSFDAVNGNGTATTFNLVDQTAAAFPGAPASSTLTGLTTVNLSRTGAAAASNAVAVTDTSFGTGVKALNVTSAGALTTAGAASAVMNSASSVSFVNTSGTSWTTVDITDTSTTAALTGSTLNTVTVQGATGATTLTGNAISTVNLNNNTGATTITAAAGTRALTINESGTVNNGAVTDAQATSVTLNVSGAQTAGLVTAAKATSFTVNTTAAASTSINGAVATTLNIGGTKSNTLTVTAPALTSAVVTGSGGVTVDLSAIATVTSVDLSGSTAVLSAANATTNNIITVGTNAAVTGGAGNDFITVGATTKAITLGGGNNQVTLNAGTTAMGTGGSIYGGSGSADVLVLANADAVTLSTAGSVQTAFKTAVTGFEVLGIGNAAATTINVGGFGSFNTLNFTTQGVTQTLSGVTSGFTLNATFGATQTSLTTNNLGGASDVLNINLKGDLSTARAFGTFTTPGVETINLSTVDSTVGTITGTKSTVTLTDAGLQSLVITGNNGVNVTATSVALTNFNASALTGAGVTWTSGNLVGNSVVQGSSVGGDVLNLAGALASTNITVFAGNNTVSGSSTVANTITAGAGNDTINGGSGADTISAGNGTNVVYADNQGTKESQTVTFTGTTTSAATGDSVVIDGITVQFANGSSAAATADNMVTAVNGTANLQNICSAATTGAGEVTITWKVDGNQSAITTAFSTTANSAVVAETVTGTAGTAAADTVTFGTGSDFIAGGGGADVLTLGAGADTVLFLQPQSTVANALAGTQATIADFAITSTASGDKIIFGTGGAVASAALTTVQDFTSVATLSGALNQAAAGNATNFGTVVFIWGGNEYVYVEQTGANATAATTDFVVKLTGTPAAAGTAVAGNFILGV